MPYFIAFGAAAVFMAFCLIAFFIAFGAVAVFMAFGGVAFFIAFGAVAFFMAFGTVALFMAFGAVAFFIAFGAEAVFMAFGVVAFFMACGCRTAKWYLHFGHLTCNIAFSATSAACWGMVNGHGRMAGGASCTSRRNELHEHVSNALEPKRPRSLSGYFLWVLESNMAGRFLAPRNGFRMGLPD